MYVEVFPFPEVLCSWLEGRKAQAADESRKGGKKKEIVKK